MKALAMVQRHKCTRPAAHGVAVCLALMLNAFTTVHGQGQMPDDGIKYDRGQSVAPVFEGWIANPDGTFSLVFGYFNRNWKEEVVIPVGPDNRIEPGGPDRGQPTYFNPRRGKNLFEIVVPGDFGKKEIVWTLTTRGKTERAHGTLIPEQVINRRMVSAGTILADNAAAGNDDVGDEKDPNLPPSVNINPVAPASVSSTASVTANVSDDGILEGGGRAPRQLRVDWSVYRAPAKVAFDPPTGAAPNPKGGSITTAVRFTAPGTYWLRATATDAGRLTSSANVTITVNPK